MKLHAFAFILAVLTGISLGVSAETPTQWSKVHMLPLTFPANLVGFFDDQFGLTVGYAGEIHQSLDGGNTWPRVHNNSACRFGLEIVDQQTAFHCGNLGQVGKTVDGGQNWTRIATFSGSEPAHARYLSFYDPEHGWIATPSKLGASENGGTSWTPVPLPKGMGKILAIARLDLQSGAVFDAAGVLWQTTDAGANWNKTQAVTDPFSNTVEFAAVACLRLSDWAHATLVYYRLGDQPSWIVRQSSDGGKTWTDQAIEGPYANPWLDRTAHFLTTTDSIKKEVTVFELK